MYSNSIPNFPMADPPFDLPTEAKGQAGFRSIDPGAINPCKYKFTYIWLENGDSFWVWLTYVGRRSIAGWKWNGCYWIYFGVDLRKIDSFYCY
ncbi:hypothetical protein OW763_01220 [Clostridium aestuarii]|uniref:Transporter n=1 Tax=Clostridium aestuarii TaxID=338193 RepID=A0ABT4CVI2_9CLOT|nr:hypothetical protein [Clostridium aestuarii]MCY6482976.1 hypothetical protein [Clostridium aestuarii]